MDAWLFWDAMSWHGNWCEGIVKANNYQFWLNIELIDKWDAQNIDIDMWSNGGNKKSINLLSSNSG